MLTTEQIKTAKEVFESLSLDLNDTVAVLDESQLDTLEKWSSQGVKIDFVFNKIDISPSYITAEGITIGFV